MKNIEPGDLKEKVVVDRNNRRIGVVNEVEKNTKRGRFDVFHVELEPDVSRRYFNGVREAPLDMSSIDSFEGQVVLSRTIEDLNKKWSQMVHIGGRSYMPHELVHKPIFDKNGQRIGTIESVIHEVEGRPTESFIIKLDPKVKQDFNLEDRTALRMPTKHIKTVTDWIEIDCPREELFEKGEKITIE